MNIWSEVRVDKETYKKGLTGYDSGYRGYNTDYLRCNCEDCQILKQVAQTRGNINLYSVIRAFKAEYKMIDGSSNSIEVTKPGFLYLERLAEKTENKATSVFVTSAGKLSYQKIYKSLDKNFELVPGFSDVFGGEIHPQLKHLIGKAIVLDPNAVTESDLYKQFIVACDAEIKKDVAVKQVVAAPVEKKEPVFAIDRNKTLLIDDRYILYFTMTGSAYDWNPYQIALDNGDICIKSVKLIDGLSADDNIKSAAYFKKLGSELGAQGSYSSDTVATGNGYGIYFFAYDMKESKLIRSLDITDIAFRLLRDNLGKLEAKNNLYGMAGHFKEILTGMDLSPIEFAEQLKAEFAKEGVSSFSLGEIHPQRASVQYYHHDWKERRGVTYSGNRIGYLAEVKHKDKPFISSKGAQGGFVQLRYDKEQKRVILVQSAWCQRVTSWSKNQLQEIDQKYDIWPIVDWLTGPFSEKIGLTLKEAPTVFLGNQAGKTKKDALDILRNKFKKLGK